MRFKSRKCSFGAEFCDGVRNRREYCEGSRCEPEKEVLAELSGGSPADLLMGHGEGMKDSNDV